jgi:hypothetical protein
MNCAASKSADRPVVSTASILIISGFLFGMAVAVPLGEMASDVASCGIAGLLAYIAFEFASWRRDVHHAHQEQRMQELRLQRHLDKVNPLLNTDLDEKVRLLEWLTQETETLSQ